MTHLHPQTAGLRRLHGEAKYRERSKKVYSAGEGDPPSLHHDGKGQAIRRLSVTRQTRPSSIPPSALVQGGRRGSRCGGACYRLRERVVFPIARRGDFGEWRAGGGSRERALAEVLEEHDYFGAVPGRLLSVGGNVLEERGGEPCAVSRQGEQLAPEQVEGARIQEGDVFTVADGTDTEEASTEETQEIAPGIHRETGGAIQFVSQWGKAGSKRVKTGEVSGETAEEVLEEPQDMVVSSVNPRPSSGKYVALTFDDGPSSYTPQILEILKEKGVRATFFNLGSQAQSNPSGSRAIVEAGQELASHTMAHRNLSTVDRDTLRSEISDAFDSIEGAGGGATTVIRPPYGDYDDEVVLTARKNGYEVVQWNVDSLDWKEIPAEEIVQRVTGKVQPGLLCSSTTRPFTRRRPSPASLRPSSRTVTPPAVSELLLPGDYPDDYSIDTPADSVPPGPSLCLKTSTRLSGRPFDLRTAQFPRRWAYRHISNKA